MCYVIAKDMNKQGCAALKTRLGRDLSMLTKELNELAPGEVFRLLQLADQQHTVNMRHIHLLRIKKS